MGKGWRGRNKAVEVKTSKTQGSVDAGITSHPTTFFAELVSKKQISHQNVGGIIQSGVIDNLWTDSVNDTEVKEKNEKRTKNKGLHK